MSEAQLARAAVMLDRPVPADSPVEAGAQWLVQVDALRVLGCVSVIAVHALCAPFPAVSVGVGETTLLLHYSREVFLFVSALVLTSSYSSRLDSSGRLADPWRFRRRRLRQIGLPYLCWTSIYLGLAIAHQPDTASPVGVLAGRWLAAVLTATGWYHLYFLLVTLQLALVSPPLLWLLHRTRRHHTRVLAVSLGVQLVTLLLYWAWGVPGGAWNAVVGEASLPAYQFWLIAGAIAGFHLPRWHRWLLGHRLALLAAVPLAGAALLATYFAELTSRGPIGASTPLQPIMLVWALAVLPALYVLAVTLTSHRTPVLVRWAGAGAHLSFGVYLAHPLILDLVLVAFTRFGLLAPSRWISLATLALTTTISFTACALLRRTRASAALIGRPAASTRVSPRTIAGGARAERAPG